MYVWTEKAEREWKKRFGPATFLKRRAGMMAKYQGEELKSSNIIEEYLKRGLITQKVENTVPTGLKSRARITAESAMKRWDIILELCNKGMDKTQIARALGMSSVKSLTTFMARHPIPNAPERLTKKNITKKDAQERCKAIEEMVARGMTKPQIAEKLGITTSTLYSYIRGHKELIKKQKTNKYTFGGDNDD